MTGTAVGGGGDEPPEHYETILESIRDGVYQLDPEGRITWVNDVAIDAFDSTYDREDLVGSHVTKILSADDIETCIQVISNLLSENHESATCEVTIRDADGTEIPTELHLTLLPFENGEFQGTVGVARDITARKRREQQLTVLNRVLRHNVRNEMNVILGYAERMAADDTLDHDHRETIAAIRASASDLAALAQKARYFDDLLNRREETPTSIDCVSLVRGVSQRFQTMHPEARIEHSFPNEAVVLAGEYLEIAVANLLENAIQHNPTDVPLVEIEIDADRDETVEIVVRDNGPGIPDEEIAVLDQSVESPLDHGSGLGLWLVNWIVTNLDGRLVFTETETGTAVRVVVPAG